MLIVIFGVFFFLTFVCALAHVDRSIKQEEEEEDLVLLHHRRLEGKASTNNDPLLLFGPHPDIKVFGPSGFPKPTDYAKHYYSSANGNTNKKDDRVLVPHWTPLFGTHRPDQDAVLAIAAEYSLDNYLVLIESLRRTGFRGDIVLSVSPLDIKNEDIRAYLQSDPHVIVYVPNLTCYNFEGEAVDSVKGGMRVCNMIDIYGVQTTLANGTTVIKQFKEDLRPARTVSITRYEMYWLMALPYQAQQWLMLIDSRDAYFQTNPFADVPRKTDPTGQSGLLYFFGENAEATRIGASKMNRKWLTYAYGDVVANTLKDRPIVCSGATMGEQVAIETYLRAMVAESDETGTRIYGADQGFHNYLYYSHKLGNADTIHAIVVFEQGMGIVNNLGAMRTKPLSEWGNGKILGQVKDVDAEDNSMILQVLNWDGTPSPVLHQYDRHSELTQEFYKRKRYFFRKDYNARLEQMTREAA